MSCINLCGKPCCHEMPKSIIQKCIACKCKVEEWYVCKDRNCSHVFANFNFVRHLVIFCGQRLPGLRVCHHCRGSLVNISYQTSTVESNLPAFGLQFSRGFNPCRLFKTGATFEYLYVQFAGGLSYTIRKELK